MDYFTNLMGSSNKKFDEAQYSKVDTCDKPINDKKIKYANAYYYQVGIVYSYKWTTLEKYPDFSLTKAIKRSPHLYNFNMKDGCPDVYKYINRYILYGAKLNVEYIAKNLFCSPEVVMKAINRFGFDREICLEPSDDTKKFPNDTKVNVKVETKVEEKVEEKVNTKNG